MVTKNYYPDPYHYVDLGNCHNCRHGLLFAGHTKDPNKSEFICFHCGYREKEE